MPQIAKLKITTGDGYRLLLTFTDRQRVAQDMSGYTYKSQLRPHHDSIRFVDFSIDDSQVTEGILVLTLTASQTRSMKGVWKWDLERSIVGQDPTTILSGTAQIIPDITR